MFWIGVDGQWAEPGPNCYLQGFDLGTADTLAQNMFPGHMRDTPRTEPTAAQTSLARSLGVPNAEDLDRRDLSDMLALAQADHWFPHFTTGAA